MNRERDDVAFISALGAHHQGSPKRGEGERKILRIHLVPELSGCTMMIMQLNVNVSGAHFASIIPLKPAQLNDEERTKRLRAKKLITSLGTFREGVSIRKAAARGVIRQQIYDESR